MEEISNPVPKRTQGKKAASSVVRDQAAKSRVTLVYAAKDERQNDAMVLLEFLWPVDGPSDSRQSE